MKMLNVKACLFHVFKMGEQDVEDSCQCFKSQGNREVKHDVYGKRQTAKMKLLPSVFSSLYSRNKIFVFAVNSKRHLSIFV